MGIPGRLLPTYLADRYFGPLNTLIPFVFVAGLLIFCWIAVTSTLGLIAFSVVYGVFGAGIQALFVASTSTPNYRFGQDGCQDGHDFYFGQLCNFVRPAIGRCTDRERPRPLPACPDFFRDGNHVWMSYTGSLTHC